MTRLRNSRYPGFAAALMAVACIGFIASSDSRQDVAVTGGSLPVVDTTAKGDRLLARREVTQEVATHFQNAVIMLHAKEYDYAITALQRVLELAPRMPEAYVNMGFALLGQGHPGAAGDFFLVAIELRPGQVNAYWGLAASLEARCDYAGAMGAMRSYIHLTAEEDRYLPRARAALWEWEAVANSGHNGGNTVASGQGKVANCIPDEVIQ